MATLEKPKPKKHKTKKPKPEQPEIGACSSKTEIDEKINEIVENTSEEKIVGKVENLKIEEKINENPEIEGKINLIQENVEKIIVTPKIEEKIIEAPKTEEKIIEAPKIEEKIQIIKYPALPLSEQSQIKPQPSIITEKCDEYIKAFTESQLTALYTNQEITASRQFIHQFIETELRGIAAKKHPLYDLITSYLSAREKLKDVTIEISQLRNDFKDTQDQLWSVTETNISGKGACADGTTLGVTHPYNVAKFHWNVLESLGLLQKKIKRLGNHSYTLYSFNCCLFKLKIEYYLDKVYKKCETYLNTNGGVVLREDPSDKSGGTLQDLRLCISVLFYFQRQLHKDKDVVAELRHWLTNMISLLLRNADWQDHMYLLNHVLRCPAGIHQWATTYIQVPSPMFYDRCDTPFANRFVNHIIAVLSVILLPVEKRDAFLEQMVLNDAQDMVNENLWVVVDSDGESDDGTSCGVLSLKENDLVALLNQIPLDYLFSAVLLIEQKNNEAFLDVSKLSEHHILRLFAFSTILIKLLNNGLESYATMRYNQFAKRLCRLMRHVLQYASDAWEIFKMCNCLSDTAMLNRLQVEFDAFFLRTSVCLFNAQARGSWQFLAIAPFHMVSIRVLWQFFYMLHLEADLDERVTLDYYFDFKAKLMETSTRQQFNERLNEMSVEQSYYLLNTFGNMILARNSIDDSEFIKFATLNLLQIGFTETENQESSRKTAAILLANITQKYPTLISDLLSYIRTNIDNFEPLIFLFSELPLFLWRPSSNDFEILSAWLLDFPATSVQNFLSRKIFLNLNWNYDAANQLFLPLNLHRQTAVLLIEAVEKHQQPLILMKFAWSLIFQLRLHSIDRGTQNVENIPEIIRHDELQRGVRQKMALALYCAVAMTTVGHLIPLVCSDGLDCLLQLTLQNHYEATLFGLYQIVPLFLNNIDALLMCTIYQNIVANILNNTANLESFSSMIQMHLHHPEWRNPLFIFWTKSLLITPQWNTNKNILFLLNRIVEVAFFMPDIYQQIEVIFHEILIEKLHDRKNGGTNSSLLSWVPLVGNSGLDSSVLIPGNGPEETWLMYLIISLEQQQIESKTGLWHELLKQLFVAKGRTNIDATLKKVTNKLKIPNYTSNGLCIYRWSQLALDTPLNHPLLPLIWQKFFFLYLERIPGPENNGSIGNKFFDGVINTSFLKKIKKRLLESVEYLKKEIEELSEESEQKKLCLNIFKAYILWLEEPIIMEATLYFPSLPPQYEPRYLSHTIQKTTSPWMELINLDIIRKNYEQNLNKWIQITERKIKYRPPLQKTQTGDVQDPRERLLRRLVSYDRPAPAPQFKRSVVVIPALQLVKPEEIRARFHPEMKKLQQYAEIYTLQVSEHTALESQFKELIPKLYHNFTMKMTFGRTCKATCAGAASIKICFKESRINESIQNQIEGNRINFANLLTRSLQPSAMSMCVTCACVQQTVELLIAMNQQPIGIELFFYFLDEFTEEFKLFPPTQQTFFNCLERLGDVFLKGAESQIVRLLHKIIEKPGRSPLIIPHFNPVNLSTPIFLQVYQIICEQIQNIPEIIITLVSKFDLNNWLMSKKPRLSDRSKLIKFIFECLVKTAKNHDSLHEVYRRHLLTIFQYEFPNHYGEILQELLQHSGQQTISVAVWLDIINALAHPITINFNSTSEMIDSLRRHAISQQCLHRPELQETISLLGRYFYQERMQFGLYGLYPKYREYIAQISVFFGETYFAFTISILNSYSGEVADNLVSIHLWSKLVELFTPWLVPYSVKDNAATWIQQLTDDRAVLLPWIQADIAHAQYIFNIFVDCILFVADTLPASGCLYSNIWKFYVSHFAHTSVKDHILTVVHSNLSRINWGKFWPCLSDLELMLKVLDQYLPDSHSFLGKIFLEINWDTWLTYLDQETEDYQILSRVNHCLLHLVVKLANEPSVRQNNKLIDILKNWKRAVRWFRLDVKSIESVFDWYIMSCDPRVVISSDQLLVKEIDKAVYDFLKFVSYKNLSELHEGKSIALQKRLCYIRAWNRIIINCSTRHKNLFTSNEQLFTTAIFTQITVTSFLYFEDDTLMREILTIINNPTFTRITANRICSYLAELAKAKPIENKFLFLLMRSIYVISDDDASSSILEQIFLLYFQLNDDWKILLQQLTTLPPKPKYDTVLIQNGRLFTLYAILSKKMEYSRETLTEQLETIINWLTQIKIDDSNEIRLPLFWIQIIRLTLKLCDGGQQEMAAMFLNKFVNQHLLLIEENKNPVSWGRGLLGAIGLIKPNNCVSIEFRFICKTMAAFILAQLPDTKNKTASVRTKSGDGCCVGQPGGNPECAKVLLKLEIGMPQEIKAIVETSLKYIQNPENSLINAEEFLISLINQIDKFYGIQHLKNI